MSARPLIGVAVILWRDQEVLLGERLQAGGNCWQFPGGHLESAESVIDCARRELAEETGLELQSPRLAQFTNQQTAMNGRHYITLYVTAEANAGEPVVKEPDRCRQWQWYDWQRLPAPLFQPIVDYLDQYGDLRHACARDIPASGQQ